MAWHGVRNSFSVTAGAALDRTATYLYLASEYTHPPVPYWLDHGGEIVEVTAVTPDTPSSGLDRLTIVRGQAGTEATTHSSGVIWNQNAYAGQVSELQDMIDRTHGLIATILGGRTLSGVVRTDADTDLKVAAQSTPNMTVQVTAGAGIVSGVPVLRTTTATTSALVAPTSNPRIDLVQIDAEGTVSVVTGTEAASPSAPSASAGCMGLATIALATSTTTITSGLITDVRTML